MATCVEAMSCFPKDVMEIWKIFEYQYGIPVSVALGIFVGIIILAIYVRTRSIAHLAVMGIYAISVFSAMWATQGFFEENVKLAIYIIALAMASVVVMVVLKLVKE